MFRKLLSLLAESGSISRKVLLLSAVVFIPLGLLSLSLYVKNAGSGSEIQKSGSISASTISSKANTESAPDTEVVTQTENTDAGNDSSVSVRINGEEVPIPENGNVNKTIPTEDGTVNVQVQGGAETNSADSDSHSSINVQVNNDSSSDTDTRTRIRIRQR